MAKCGRTNLAGGGGVGSDELTVTNPYVLEGKTYVGSDTNDEIGTGTMTDYSVIDESIGGYSSTYPEVPVHVGRALGVSDTTVSGEKYVTVIPPEGYFNNSARVGVPQADAAANIGLTAAKIATGNTILGVAGTYKGLGNATAAQVLSGKTFSTASLSNTTGTMKNYSGYTSTSNYVSSTFRSGTTGYVFASPGGTGYYSTSSYLRIPATNLAAGNIKKGVSILGITGTFEGYVSSPLYFFDSTGWHNLTTTGITVTKRGSDDIGWRVTSNTTVSGETKRYLSCTTDSSARNIARFNQTVNLSNYKYLKFAVGRLEFPNSNSSYIGVGIHQSSNIDYHGDITTITKMYDYGTGILNISSISGYWYIYLVCYHNATTDDESSLGSIYLSNT